MTRTPLTGPSVWQGKDIKSSRRWIRELSPDPVDRARGGAQAVQGLPWQEITRADFPLPTLGDLVDDIADELENGCGIMKLRGFPVDQSRARTTCAGSTSASAPISARRSSRTAAAS